jgi:hypothetical protein
LEIFKTRVLARFARRERISDRSLIEAVERAERGLVDADLGGGLIKQRVARAGQGRSGGYRMLVACRKQGRAIFLSGFAKNEADNIDQRQLLNLRRIADGWSAADEVTITQALSDGALQEVDDDEATEPIRRRNH